jgi:lipopolysaccharide export LptBFGC system permease protein LptF
MDSKVIYFTACLMLCGCSLFDKDETPVIPQKNEHKDEYINKVHGVVSDSASALTAVAPVVQEGVPRDLVNNQVQRLSGIAKPSVEKVREYERAIKENDKKAVSKDKTEADKVAQEAASLIGLIVQKDAELDAANEELELLEKERQREIKDKQLWQYSTAGLAMFVSAVLMIAFTPFKKNGFVVLLGGVAAMSTAWLFDSTWFPWVAGGSVAVCLVGVLVAVVPVVYVRIKQYLHKSPSE